MTRIRNTPVVEQRPDLIRSQGFEFYIPFKRPLRNNALSILVTLVLKVAMTGIPSASPRIPSVRLNSIARLLL
jgi:hypothetical protein